MRASRQRPTTLRGGALADPVRSTWSWSRARRPREQPRQPAGKVPGRLGPERVREHRQPVAHRGGLVALLDDEEQLLATASGVFDSNAGWGYLALLLILSGAAIYLGIRFQRFAFVAYGTVYGYAGLSVRLLDSIGEFTGVLAYFAVTGSLVVFALVVLARRFGRAE